ncbi:MULTISPECIES: 3'-5' exonuclease [Bacillus cereus group]|nr:MULTISPECIES: 3'-5' exonuclease [Bacillus cereus group]
MFLSLSPPSESSSENSWSAFFPNRSSDDRIVLDGKLLFGAACSFHFLIKITSFYYRIFVMILSRYSWAVSPLPQDLEKSKEDRWGITAHKSPIGSTNHQWGMKSVDDERPLVIDAKREENKEDMKTHIMPYIQERYRQIKEINEEKTNKENVTEEKEKLAVLTRTIDEARLIHTWCKEMNVPSKLEVGGNFFTSKAVRDFYSLTLFLLYPKNKKYLANVLNGPYGQSDTYLLHELLASNGNDFGINRLIRESSNIDFQDYINQLKYHPVLAVLRSIIQEVNPYHWVYSRKLDERKENQTSEFDEEQLKQEAAIHTKQYELNIGKLFEMMHQRFSEEFVSLHQITNWLYVQIATNREEDEIQV